MQSIIEKEPTLEDRFVDAFKRSEGLSLNGTHAGIQHLRKAAIGRFAALGFPARKAEAWKYTNIGKILKRDYALAPDAPAGVVGADDVAPLLIPGLDAHVAVFVNGHFSPALSKLDALPDGVVVTGLVHAAASYPEIIDAHFAKYADYEGEAFTALNTAFTRDGAFVYVPKHAVVERPVHVIHFVTADAATMLQPRNLYVVEENARFKLIETSEALSKVPTFVNGVTEVFIGPRAHVDLYEIQDEHEHTSMVNTLNAYQQRGSVFRTSTFTLSGEVIRNNTNILPDAEECETHLYGLFMGDGTMHVDNHTIVDHAMPNCFSNELFKGILDDRATGVFNGRVLVRRDAQQINAYQSNKTIVLTDTASMYAKPELEIYADDVKCSHGATTGQLDKDAIFYLRSRGLSEASAKAMLLIAFARDVLDNVTIEPLRDYLDDLVSARFSN